MRPMMYYLAVPFYEFMIGKLFYPYSDTSSFFSDFRSEILYIFECIKFTENRGMDRPFHPKAVCTQPRPMKILIA